MGQAKIKRQNIALYDAMFIPVPDDEFPEPEQTDAQKAADKAIKEIRSRSFSGRHPEQGKMLKCQVCNRRHRASVHHEQKFATGRYDLRDPKPLLIAGVTPETESLIEERRIRLVVGAAGFKGKRKHPPLNKRSNEFVQVVRYLLPDDYTHEELEKARRKAKRILAEKYGRYGFLPLLWQSQKETREKATKEVGSAQAAQSSETEVSVS